MTKTKNAQKERIKKYICPLCGTTGLKSRKGLRRHCAHMHKEITKEAFEAAWKESEREFEARVPAVAHKAAKQKTGAKVPAKSSGQQTTPQPPSEPNTRNSKPDVARKMVKLGATAPETPKKPSKPKPKAKAQHLKPVPMPPETLTPLTGVLAIPKGSQLMIDGDIYYQDDAGFLPVKVERVAMTVGLRQASPDGRTWLYCRVDGVIYGLDERLVLSGSQQLISLPPPVAVPDGPPTTTCEVEEPVADVKYREQLPEFMDALKAYYAVKQQAADVEKLLKVAREDHYDHIYNFTMAHGSESEKDKLDYVLYEAGYRSWLHRVPGRTQTKYNDAAIIQWCIDNGHEEVLCRALDKKAWEALKDTGVVPESITQLYEQTLDIPDMFRLNLYKEEGEEQ